MNKFDVSENEHSKDIALSYPYGEVFHIGDVSSETLPEDMEEILIALFGITEIVVDGEVYYKE